MVKDNGNVRELLHFMTVGFLSIDVLVTSPVEHTFAFGGTHLNFF